jgi:hypothetical protein
MKWKAAAKRRRRSEAAAALSIALARRGSALCLRGMLASKSSATAAADSDDSFEAQPVIWGRESEEPLQGK